MMRRSRFLVLAAGLLLAGCVSRAQQVAVLNAMIGLSEADLVRRLGVPSRSFETAGHKFLAYDSRSVDVIPGWGAGWGGWGPWGSGFGWYGGPPPMVVERGCETTFEIDQGRVTSWSQRGNAC